MVKDNFLESLKKVLVHEGGFVNHPRDPGGATNKGVTQGVYDAYRKRVGKATQSVKNISAVEVAEIYKNEYWDAVRGDRLPSGVDYAVFDFAVNSGVRRAVKFLQKAVGAVPDGAIGPATIAAVEATNSLALIDSYCNARQRYLESLDTFAVFGKGWTTRVAGVRAAAKDMAK